MSGTSEVLAWTVTISMVFTMMFSSYMLINQYIGISLGMGTIDRYEIAVSQKEIFDVFAILVKVNGGYTFVHSARV